MKKALQTAVQTAVLAAATFAFAGPSLAAVPESDDPIIIVQNNWTSQNVLSFVVGKVLEDMGYAVEYTPSDSSYKGNFASKIKHFV